MASFDRRFNTVFYGHAMPRLQRITQLGASLDLSPREYWQSHRRNTYTMVRMAKADPKLGRKLEKDRKLLEQALSDLDECRKLAVREKSHLDHWEDGIRRTLSVVHRMQLGAEVAAKKPAAGRVRSWANQLTRELASVRQQYAGLWLRHNKRENIEVSLDVFDRMADQLKVFAAAYPFKPAVTPGFAPVDLSRHYNVNYTSIGGVPIGPAVFNDVPFRFADSAHTHLELKTPGQSIDLPVGPLHLADLHLIAAGRCPNDRQPRPGLRVEVLRDDLCIVKDELLHLTHLVDWWAPFGEHMWAGGGFRYVDPLRVQPALKPNEYHGLMQIHRFGLVGKPKVNRIRLTALSGEPIQIFALTLETAYGT
jgi:hypothetical protein